MTRKKTLTKNASVCRTPIHLSEVILTHQNQDTRTLKSAKREVVGIDTLHNDIGIAA